LLRQYPRTKDEFRPISQEHALSNPLGRPTRAHEIIAKSPTRLRGLLPGLVAVCLLAPLSIAEAAKTSTYSEAHISYLTTVSVYLDQGREAGLEVGNTVDLMRGGEAIAKLTVSYVSAHRAVCDVTGSAMVFGVGDLVRFVPSAKEPVPPTASETLLTETKPRRRTGRLREMGLSGRIGVRYLSVESRSDTGSSFSQPSLDFRLDGTNIGGSPIGLAVDVRTRRSYRTAVGGETETDGRTQVYRMAAIVQAPGSPFFLIAGRQFSSTLASVSIFDGVMGEYRGDRWSSGMFSGTQPDPTDFGISNEIREHGVYVQVHNKLNSIKKWAFTTGVIGSYQDHEVNREFVYLQTRYNHKRLSFYLAQEVDYNRGWKEEAGEDRWSDTSTFVNLGLRASNSVSFNVGYDNRRSIRLYRSLVTPETEFDDSYRKGGWVGTRVRFAKRYRVDLRFRSSGGGTAGDADSYTFGFGASRMIPGLKLDFRSRSTQYTNQQVEGWLHSAGLGRSIGRRVHLELNGGLREETGLSLALQDSRLTWYGAELDVNLGRHVYLSVSGERSEGAAEDNDQIYSSLSYRF